jgi:hypothetical protein
VHPTPGVQAEPNGPVIRRRAAVPVCATAPRPIACHVQYNGSPRVAAPRAFRAAQPAAHCPAGASTPEFRRGVFLGVIQIVAEQSMPSAVCFNQWCVCSAIATQGCYLVSDVQRVQVVIIPGAIPTVLQGGVHDLP